MRKEQRLQIVGSGRETRLRLVGDCDDDPLQALCETARVGGAVDKLQRHLVERARAGGVSCAQVGSALGISKRRRGNGPRRPRDAR